MLEIIGSLFIILFGSINHFIYNLSNKNKMIAYFVSVNESTWEHLKLIVFPFFFWLIVVYHFYYNVPNIFFASFISLLLMLVLIPFLFYSYTYILNKNIAIIDILIFIIATLSGEYLFHILIKIKYSNILFDHVGILGLITIFIIFLTKTFVPSKNYLFEDPITNKYGIE